MKTALVPSQPAGASDGSRKPRTSLEEALAARRFRTGIEVIEL